MNILISKVYNWFYVPLDDKYVIRTTQPTMPEKIMIGVVSTSKTRSSVKKSI